MISSCEKLFFVSRKYQTRSSHSKMATVMVWAGLSGRDNLIMFSSQNESKSLITTVMRTLFWNQLWRIWGKACSREVRRAVVDAVQRQNMFQGGETCCSGCRAEAKNVPGRWDVLQWMQLVQRQSMFQGGDTCYSAEAKHVPGRWDVLQRMHYQRDLSRCEKAGKLCSIKFCTVICTHIYVNFQVNCIICVCFVLFFFVWGLLCYPVCVYIFIYKLTFILGKNVY